MIASSGTLTLNGLINVSGGVGGGGNAAGGGGGAVLLIANTVQGSGSVNRSGGSSSYSNGVAGLARIEAYTNDFTGTVDYSDTTPLDLDLPGSANGPPPPPSIAVTSVNGTAVNANPFSFPNLNFNSSQSVAIVITAHNIPVGTQPTLYFFSAPNDTKVTAPALQGTLATSTTTVNVVVPAGTSYGYVRATWTL